MKVARSSTNLAIRVAVTTIGKHIISIISIIGFSLDLLDWLYLAYQPENSPYLRSSDQSIADAMNGNYVLRICGICFKLVSQTRNVRIDRACVE